MTVYFGGKLKALGYVLELMLHCFVATFTDIYVGVFNEAKTTFLVVFGNDENRQNPLWPFRTFD